MDRQREAEPILQRHAEDQLTERFLSGDLQQADAGNVNRLLSIERLFHGKLQELRRAEGVNPGTGVEKKSFVHAEARGSAFPISGVPGRRDRIITGPRRDRALAATQPTFQGRRGS